MALQRLTSRVAETAASKKEEHPELKVEGLASDFAKAVADQKAAEAIVAEKRLELLHVGIPFLAEHNAHAAVPVGTIKLVDETDGTVVRLTSQNKYSAADPDAVDQLFEQMGKDANDYVQETIKASFASDIFNADEGRFSMKVYSAYEKAIADATAALIKKGLLTEGTKSPLTIKKAVLPLKAFHDLRWTEFGVDKQASISEVLPNTVTLSPVAK